MARKDDPKPPTDVLMYLDRDGGQGCVWYSKPLGGTSKRLFIPTSVRHLIQPRLDVCPAAKWADVQETEGYREVVKDGTLEVFNATGTIAEAWARAPYPQLVRLIGKSLGVEVLLRLQRVEGTLDRPRTDVSEAIETRLDDLKVKVAKHKHRAARQGRQAA